MMGDVLYAKYNRSRLPRFQTETQILQTKTSKCVVKKALTSEAAAHIDDMYRGHELLQESILDSSVRLPAIIEKTTDTLTVEYIEGISYAQLAHDAMLQKDREEFLRLADAYYEFLNHSFKTLHQPLITPTFSQFFKDFDPQLAQNERYFYNSFFDLTFDNLFIKDQTSYLIDLEWVFDCCVPVSFVCFRNFWHFYYKFNAFGIEQWFPFSELLRRWHISLAQIKYYVAVEERFQAYVAGEKFNISANYLKRKETFQHLIEHERQTYSAQLFIDTGLGFNERQSITFPVYGQERTFEFDLSAYHDIKALRFDPLNNATVLHLNGIQLVTTEGGAISIETYQTNACFQSSNNLMFSTSDPMIFFDLPVKQAQKVVIALEYVATGAATYPYLLSQKDLQTAEQIGTFQQMLQEKDLQLQQQAQALQVCDQTIQHLTPHYVVQLFIDTGMGFNEQQSLTQTITGDERLVEFDLTSYGGVQQLRFDPLNDVTVVHLYDIRIVTQKGTEYPITEYQTNAYYQSGQSFVFNTPDPNIVFISPVKRIQKIIIGLQFARLGDAAYQYIIDIDKSLVLQRDQMIQQHAQALQAKDTQLNEQAQALQSKDAQLTQQAQILDAQDAQLTQQAQILDAKDAQLTQQAQALQVKDADLRQKIKLIQSMENTLSWKMTKPLRTLRNLKLFKRRWSYHDASWKGKVLRFCARTFWPKRLILQSGLFDQEYYLKNNPDVAQNTKNPLRHFIRHGGFEGCKPCAAFDSAYYLAQNLDVAKARINPLIHYLLLGKDEKRPPSQEVQIIRESHLFDEAYYLTQNPDVAQSEIDPLWHFLWYGGIEGRQPHPLFDSAYYLGTYPDVKQSGMNPLLHYLIYGGYEGRKPNQEFNSVWYLQTYTDVAQSMTNPLVHYICHGQREGRQIAPLQAYSPLLSLPSVQIDTASYSDEGGNKCVPLQFRTRYEKWVYRNRLTHKMELFLRNEMQGFAYTPTFSLVIPVYNPPEAILVKMLESIRSQIYEHWELCVVNDGSTAPYVDKILSDYAQRDHRYKYKNLYQNQGIVEASNEALRLTSGEYIVLMDHDDTLEQDALLQIAKYLQDHQDVDILYTDNDKIDVQDRYLSPQFKPDWSPELMYSYCYIVHVKVFSRRIVDKLDGFRTGFDGSQDYDFFLRAIEHAREIAHLPLVLYHWRELPGQQSTTDNSIENGRKAVEDSLKRRGIDWVDVVQAEFAKKSQNGIYRLVPNRTFQEKISIIINVKNNYALVKACIESVEQKTTYRNYELIITDDESDDPETIAYLEKLSEKYTVLWLQREPEQGFNFSKLNNMAVKSASGEYLIFLNGDTEVIGNNWLEEMLLYCRMPEIGIVGAKLIFPDNTIQHAGVLKGFFNGLACPAFKNAPASERGYMDFAVVARNYSAVTAACLMIKKAIFTEVGGFDQINLPIGYNDVDLCLKVLQQGYRIVYSPYALLLHHEGGFRGAELSGSNNIHDEISFKERWKNYEDPYYNRNQSFQYAQIFQEAVNRNTRLTLFDCSHKKLRVLSVSHNLNFEGAPLSKLAIDQYLQSLENVELHVLSLADGPLRNIYQQLNINIAVLPLNWNTGHRGYEAFRDLLGNAIKQGRYDLVFANTLETFWAIDAAHGVNVPSLWNIRESVDFYTYFDNYPSHPAIREMAKQTFLKANRNIFVCQATANLFTSYDHYGTSEVIYNGLDVNAFEPLKKIDKNALKEELHLPLNKKIISIIGTTCPRKGQVDFAKAAVNILHARDDVCFVIVGTRETEYLSQIQDVIQDEDEIYLIAETPEAGKYFRVSDIFVCASYNESFPKVILEAMAFELPIITTPVFGIAEQIVDGKTGLFFPAGDIQSLQSHIEQLLNDPVYAKQLGENAYLTVKSKFSEQEMIKKYYQLMQVAAFEDVNTLQEGGTPATQTYVDLDAHFPERTRIAQQYLKGQGIEIGALHAPLHLPNGAQVQYVDRMSVDDLLAQYPELKSEKLVPVDIIDDGEKLSSLGDATQDFVIANHFLEHCQNPLLALENMFRVLKSGGILYLGIPDKRHSFDCDRQVTSYEHLLKDYREGPEWSEKMHVEDWVRLVNKVADDNEVTQKVQSLLQTNYSIHYHVWTQTEMMELFLNIKKRLCFEIEVVSRNINEVIFVLRKS
ncbi:glycosyltransferase [candidate division KSB1 bacterium]|nr:glycosyltransferase [candidate division KSB1 bacterium]